MGLNLGEYQLAWMAYLVAFLVLYWAWAGIVAWIPVRVARQMLKGLMAVLLLTPVTSAHVDGWLVPAWLNFSYGVLLDQPDEMGRTLFNLALAAIAMLVVLALDSAWVRYRRR